MHVMIQFSPLESSTQLPQAPGTQRTTGTAEMPRVSTLSWQLGGVSYRQHQAQTNVVPVTSTSAPRITASRFRVTGRFIVAGLDTTNAAIAVDPRTCSG